MADGCKFVFGYMGHYPFGGTVIRNYYQEQSFVTNRLVKYAGFEDDDEYYSCYPGKGYDTTSILEMYMNEEFHHVGLYVGPNHYLTCADPNTSLTYSDLKTLYLENDITIMAYPTLAELMDCNKFHNFNACELWFCEDWSEDLLYDDWSDIFE